jgi:radical SAM protein with 4Fe4S-binding SPASM domain
MKKSILDSYRDNRFYKLSTLKIKIHERCNLRCKMCNHWRVEQNAEELSTIEILKVVDEAASLDCKQVTFTGGEPTLRKDLEEIFARVKVHNMRISLLTNGFAVSSQRLSSLVANGLNKISVSIDSPESEIHDDIRGIKGAFQRSTEFLRSCVNLRHSDTSLREVMVATCLLRSNLYKLSDMVKLVKQLGADTFSIIRIDQHNFDGESMDLTDDEKKIYQSKFIPQIKNMCLENHIKFRTSGISENYGLYSETELKDLPCYFVWGNATIATNGDVHPCCDLIRSSGALLGNVRKMKLKEILDSEGAAEIRSLMNERILPACLQCYWEDDYNRRIHKMHIKSKGYAGVNGK